MEEIRQNNRVILTSNDEVTVPMIFKNLSGINFTGENYRCYLKNVAYFEMGFKPGKITYHKNGTLIATAELPDLK